LPGHLGDGVKDRFGQFLDDVKRAHLMLHVTKHMSDWQGI